MNAVCRQKSIEPLRHLDTDRPTATDRVAKIFAMASAQIGNGFNPDAGHVVGMLDARFPPCSDFDGMNELGTQIEQPQFCPT